MAEQNNDKAYLIFGVILFIVGIIMIIYGGLYLSQSETSCSGINFTEGSSSTTDGNDPSGCCATAQSTGGWLLGLGIILFLVGIWMMYKGKKYGKALETNVTNVVNTKMTPTTTASVTDQNTL